MTSDALLVTVAPCPPPEIAHRLPELDLSPEGIAAEVVRAHEAGASVAHLHVLDEHGRPTHDLAAFSRTVALIRERCNIVIEGSTGGVTQLSAAERSVALDADVEMASLNTGSVNYAEGVYINSPADIEYWAETMRVRGVKPDVAVFEAGMLTNALELMRRGLIRPPLAASFVLGQRGAMSALPRNLVFLVDGLPHGSVWTSIGHGGHDLRLAVLAMSMGGHARAGFEDNPNYSAGEPATSNAQLVERVVRLGEELGRTVVGPIDAREMLELTDGA